VHAVFVRGCQTWTSLIVSSPLQTSIVGVPRTLMAPLGTCRKKHRVTKFRLAKAGPSSAGVDVSFMLKHSVGCRDTGTQSRH
jgi:hypothetical protein